MAQFGAGGGGGGGFRGSGNGSTGSAPTEGDFANYFCTYAYLFHQKQMLEDRRRMNAYYSAIMDNASAFKDKVVLDVGTGSGVLAIWAAKAGAKRVYAVEATDMAKHAKVLVEANGLSDVVDIRQSMVEALEIPEKVDIIVSEWMGYFLLREAMLDSVVLAREKHMKPDGALYPSHARMFLAPIVEVGTAHGDRDYENAMADWNGFIDETAAAYGVDYSCLTSSFEREQRQYYKGTASWVELEPRQVLAPAAVIGSFDCNVIKAESLDNVQSEFSFEIGGAASEGVYMTALAGWFDVDFNGSQRNPAPYPVQLSTAPVAGPTHWGGNLMKQAGQLCFPIRPQIKVVPGDVLSGKIEVSKAGENGRLLRVDLALRVNEGQESTYQISIE